MKHGFIFLNPKGKNSKVRATRNARRPVIAKRTVSVDMRRSYWLGFFDTNGPIVQMSVPSGERTVTVIFYKRRILEKLNKCFEKRRPKTGLRGVRLLHDKAPEHTSSIVIDYLETKQVTMLPHPPYSSDLAPADFVLFPKLKWMLSGRKYSIANVMQWPPLFIIV